MESVVVITRWEDRVVAPEHLVVAFEVGVAAEAVDCKFCGVYAVKVSWIQNFYLKAEMKTEAVDRAEVVVAVALAVDTEVATWVVVDTEAAEAVVVVVVVVWADTVVVEWAAEAMAVTWVEIR